MYKFFRDTLMEWDKHSKSYNYSMRRITIAVCFPYGLTVGWKIVFYDVASTNLNSLEVFKTIFFFVAVGLGINLASYIKNDPQTISEANDQYKETEDKKEIIG